MNGDKIDINLLEAIAFDPYTHGYYKIGERVGNAFKDGFQLKNNVLYRNNNYLYSWNTSTFYS